MTTEEIINAVKAANKAITEPNYQGLFIQTQVEAIDEHTTVRELKVPEAIAAMAVDYAKCAALQNPLVDFALLALPPEQAINFMLAFFVAVFETGRVFERAQAEKETIEETLERMTKESEDGFLR